MHSLRRHLLSGTTVVIVAIFAALGGVLYGSVRAWLIAEVDRGLLAQAQALAVATEIHQGAARVDFEGQHPVQFQPGPRAEYFELWEAGRAVARSPSLEGRDLRFAPAAPDRPAHHFTALPGGRTGRMVSITVHPRPEDEDEAARTGPHQWVTLEVASDTADLATALTRLGWLLAGSCGAAVPACLFLLTWLIRRGLRPVSTIAGRMERVGRENLSERLDTVAVPLELLPVVQRLNEMLARLQTAFARERAFSADVAHELRTPLAGLETALEVCASRPREPREYERVVAQCLGAVRQMHSMVDTLLALARTENGGMTVVPTSFSFADLIDESWQPFAHRAATKHISVERTGTPESRLVTDRDKLRIVLHNLFDNAVSYCNDGGVVRIEALGSNGTVRMGVANTGSRLSPDQAGQVFERFWRGDVSRTGTGSHSGLGLSITRQLLTLLGGTIAVESTEAGEFRATISLPAKHPT